MNTSADIRIAGHRRRLMIMLAVDAVAVIVAVGFVIGRFQTGQSWMLGGFAVAILVGFAAQIWMVVRWWQVEKPAKEGEPR